MSPSDQNQPQQSSKSAGGPSQGRLFSEEELAPLPEWEVADAEDRLLADVVFNIPVNTLFSYIIPDHLRERIRPGMRLKLPFGRRNQLQVGYCVHVRVPRVVDDGTRERTSQYKEVFDVLDEAPLIQQSMLDLTRWIGEYYLCGWGQVLESVIPAGVKNQAGTRMVTLLRAAPSAKTAHAIDELTEKQRAALEILLSAEEPLAPEQVAREARCGLGPLQTLRKKGLVEVVRQRTRRTEGVPESPSSQPDLQLNPDQQQALRSIEEVLRKQESRTILLHGVTGSGKTEVYIQAIREVVGYGRQAIVLVPEISLTPQTIRRFRTRFASVAVLHSHLSDAERHAHWQEISQGKVQVVVGARSAVFAPCPHLGLIIIDEEHETSFKQDSTPRYHAREVARKRAEIERIPLLLGSATPTLESWQRAKQGTDLLISMPRRVEGLPMPPVIVVDIRNDPELRRGASIGRALRGAMQNALQDDGQVILFLNMRGFSPQIWCRACGAGVQCPECARTLSWHKDLGVALCHECNFRMSPPASCPHCGHAGVVYLGTGTQKLEMEIRKKFPKYPCLRMDSDAMSKPGSHHRALELFRKEEVRILLGTQMIAKGLDFPNVTLVGVINADTSLHQPDLRATERTFHLIAQVAGRTGRSARGGRVLVQTASPEEPAILWAAKHQFEPFANAELETRNAMLSPPFVHLARVILRGANEPQVAEVARGIAELLKRQKGLLQPTVRILGPAPAPLSKSKGMFRYHLQLSAEEVRALHELWELTLPLINLPTGVEMVIDVDPMNMR